MNPQIVDKVFFVVHPAFGVAYGNERNRSVSFQEADNFVRNKLIPVVKEVQGNPSALLVFVKSPNPIEKLEQAFGRGLPDSFIQGALNPSVLRKLGTDLNKLRELNQIESDLERQITRMLKHRAIVLRDASEERAARNALKEIRQRGFDLLPQTVVEGRGSWREECATDFANAFARKAFPEKSPLPFRRVRVPESGSISLRPRSSVLKRTFSAKKF